MTFVAALLAAITNIVADANYSDKENCIAKCAMDEVIFVQRARYGCTDFGSCVRSTHGFVGCMAYVILHLDCKCSGRDSSHFTMPNSVIYKLRPRPEGLVSYLEVIYDCVTIKINSKVSCHEGKGVLDNSPLGGYLSSALHFELDSVDSQHCPG